jgi:hypothetical protein
MKKIIITIASMALSVNLCAQTSLITGLSAKTRSNIVEWKKEIYQVFPSKRISARSMEKYSFSKLLQMSFDMGYIGSNYQRLYMTFEKVLKKNATEYEVSGFSQVKQNVCNFKGTLKITEFNQLKTFSEYCDNEGYLLGEFKLTEDANQSSSGIFQGIFFIKWYVADNKLRIDDWREGGVAIAYNNLFYGEWTSNLKKTTKDVCWGEGKIPFSGDLIRYGDGDFFINEKYLDNGWEDFKEISYE